MKKILPFVVIGILVLGGLGAVALESDKKELNSEILDIEYKSGGSRDYTHTVLVEVGTATWCSSCPASNAAWHSIYGSGNYDFEYIELVDDENSVASARFGQFNPRYVPTSYWDGGENVLPGTSYGTFYNYLDASGSRVVPDLVADLDVLWQGNAKIEITYNVQNNEASNYPGRLRIYVIELESTLWNDFIGNPYYHAFLDFAVNQVIDISAGGSISDTIVWDGSAEGYPNIASDNIQVILAVFDDEAHQSYSDPPSGNPFLAYYSDECIAAIPEVGPNNPPGAPEIDGPAKGEAGVAYDYDFTAIDPDGNDISYYIKWGDGDITEWTTLQTSGTSYSETHVWSEQGTFTIEAKVRDSEDAESGWETFQVTMPRNKVSTNTLFQQILERFPNGFPILGQFLQRLGLL